MDIYQLLNLGKDKLTPFEGCFRGIIRKRKTLQNGWHLMLLKNDMVILYKDDRKDIAAGGIRRVFEAEDGKFMFVKKNGSNALFDKEGRLLTDFVFGAKLFKNGWYRLPVDGAYALYTEKGVLVADKLSAAEVYPNGHYYLAAKSEEKADNTGLFETNGKQVLAFNSENFKMLKNGWFIVDGSLYDNFGDFFLGLNDGTNLSRIYLTAVGSVMPVKRRE